jgi:superkiller protein 3
LPDNPHALCLLGTVHQRFASEATAKQLWERALQLQPQFADAHLALGRQAISAGDFSEAELHLRAALLADPSWDQVPLPLAEVLQAHNKHRDVVELLEPFVERQPHVAEAWWRLGLAYAGLSEHSNARRCHLQAIAADPNSADAHYGAALAYSKCGQRDQAEQHFQRSRELRIHEIKAAEKSRMAITDEDKVRNVTLRICLEAASVCAIYGLEHEAERHWRRAAKLDPKNIESRERLCEFLALKKRWEEAIPYGRELCGAEPEHSRHWLRLGILYGQRGEPDEAAAALQRAVALSPERAEAYAAWAEVEMFPGRNVQEAIALARKAVDKSPSPRHHYLLGMAHWRGGQLLPARESLERAIRLAPEQPEYRESLTRLLIETRNGP